MDTRKLRRACALAVCAVPLLASNAQAATNVASISIGTYPAGFYGPTVTSTGFFDGFYGSRNQDGGVPTRVVQLRNGVPIADSRTETPVSVVPGDVFQLRNTTNDSVITQHAYTSPALSPTSCVGQNGFSGNRAPDADISVETVVPFTRTFSNSGGPYGGGGSSSFVEATRKQVGRIRALGTGTFSGVFDAPIAAGDFLATYQVIENTTADTDFTFTTSVIQPAGACPPPPAPVKDVTPAKVVSFDLGTTEKSVKSFLKSGLISFVGVNEPGIISQELYLSNGAKLPTTAKASAAKCKKGFALKTVSVKKKVKGKTRTVKVKKCVKSKAKRSLVGKGRTVAKSAGVFKVTVKATSAGKKLLKAKKTYKLVLITTVRDTAGNITKVPNKAITLTK